MTDFKQSIIETPLGDMIAIADDHALHLLEFKTRKNLDMALSRFTTISDGRNAILDMIASELDDYFHGRLTSFQTPLKIYGSNFQQSVMKSLTVIPHGQTQTYKDQSIGLNNPKAVRAVARANSMNQIAIVIPCHRVIGSNGKLTGYAGGLDKKQWLLNHEKKCA